VGFLAVDMDGNVFSVLTCRQLNILSDALGFLAFIFL
jgi:hypothetical protein